MVRYIYITKNKNIEPEIGIISIQDFCNGETGIDDNNIEDIFDDMTSNFEDLGFWNSEEDLVGKTPVEIKKKIEIILNHLRAEGYTSRKWTTDDEESYTIPSWMFGHTNPPTGRASAHGIDYFDLPMNERVEILMFHLENILNICKNYDETYSVFLK